jgi:hypothetical protein
MYYFVVYFRFSEWNVITTRDRFLISLTLCGVDGQLNCIRMRIEGDWETDDPYAAIFDDWTAVPQQMYYSIMQYKINDIVCPPLLSSPPYHARIV